MAQRTSDASHLSISWYSVSFGTSRPYQHLQRHLAWEGLTFASAWLGSDYLAGNAVLLTSATFLYFLPTAISTGASTRVGNYLGKDEAANAKIAALTALGIGALSAGTTAALLAIFRMEWVYVFSEDEVVFTKAYAAMPCFCLIMLSGCIQSVDAGALRGAGLPEDIAKTCLICHWLCGIPLAYFFAFSSLAWGLSGLWGGFAIGLTAACAKLSWQVLTNDWQASAKKAQAHIHITTEHVQDVESRVIVSSAWSV